MEGIEGPIASSFKHLGTLNSIAPSSESVSVCERQKYLCFVLPLYIGVVATSVLSASLDNHSIAFARASLRICSTASASFLIRTRL